MAIVHHWVLPVWGHCLVDVTSGESATKYCRSSRSCRPAASRHKLYNFFGMPPSSFLTPSIRSFRSIRPQSIRPTQHFFHYSTTARMSTTNNTLGGAVPDSQTISNAAQNEGGPSKGSESAQMQSQVGKTQVGPCIHAPDQCFKGLLD